MNGPKRATGASITVGQSVFNSLEKQSSVSRTVPKYGIPSLHTAPSRWTAQAAFVRHDNAWLHGEVIRAGNDEVVLQTHAGDQVTCPARSALLTDPILALLLSPTLIDATLDISGVKAAHATILTRLLGDAASSRNRPSRDISRLLDGIVPSEAIPDGTRECVWTSAPATSHRFPLQHAVDFVFVKESSARRISRSVRTGVGEDFFLPPPACPTTPRPRRAPQVMGAPPSVPSGSFFESDSEVEDAPSAIHRAEQTVHLRGSDTDRHARLAADLQEFPEVLDHYLTTLARRQGSENHLKRRRTDYLDEASGGNSKKPKSHFQPPQAHRRVHKLVSAAVFAGTSAHDFVDEKLNHVAVTFAPHPGVLLRLYDFQFGVRGLSIMHLAQLDPLARMAWVMASTVNMQDFSSTVPLPKAPSAHNVDDILAALAGLRTYCVAFCAEDAINLVEAMYRFVQQMMGILLWTSDDFKYLVYWLDKLLEDYRTCAHNDVLSGEATRVRVQDKLVSSNPDLQLLNQLITSRNVEQLMASRNGPSLPLPRADRVVTVTKDQLKPYLHSATTRSREYESSTPGRGSGVPPEIQELIPRQHGRQLCLRSISAQGCAGAPGRPDRCQFFKSRAHFVPSAKLPQPLRAYINQRFGGLHDDLRHL